MNKLLIPIILIASVFIGGCAITQLPPSPSDPTYSLVLSKAKNQTYNTTQILTLALIANTEKDKRPALVRKLNSNATVVENILNTEVTLEQIRTKLAELLASSGSEDAALNLALFNAILNSINEELNVSFKFETDSQRLAVLKELGLSAAKAIKDSTAPFIQ